MDSDESAGRSGSTLFVMQVKLCCIIWLVNGDLFLIAKDTKSSDAFLQS